MPIYEYTCDCGMRSEKVKPMAERAYEYCGKCGKVAKLCISTSSIKVFHQMTLFDLAPEGTVTVNSSKELKYECKKRGVEYDGPGKHANRKRGKIYV